MKKGWISLAEHKGVNLDLAAILRGPAPGLIAEPDTLGTFQIESRAQMSMLLRASTSRTLYDRRAGRDRPGRSIQGRRGHPYLRRRRP